MIKTNLAKAVFLAGALSLIAMMAVAGPLENLERERAHLVRVMIDPSLAPAERQSRLEQAARRLVDMERMVIRDKDLAKTSSPTASSALTNYELTFLAHASVEKGVSLTEHWLNSVGLSTPALMSTRMGRRW